MTRDTRRAGAFLVALGSAIAVLALVAGPASAQTSGGAIATDGSVASGSADASRNSTASGDAVARDNSVASGCSTALRNSTASGDDCEVERVKKKEEEKRVVSAPSGGAVVGVGGGAPTARAAAPTAARLALTGSWSAPLAAVAALAIALGALLVVSASDRRRLTLRA